MKKRIVSMLLLVCMTTTLAMGCGGSEEEKETVDLNSMSLDEIEAQAKE